VNLQLRSPRAQPFGGATATLSVIVVSHNEGDYLRRTVESLLVGLPPRGEILVVDDDSTDGSADSLRGAYDRVQILRPQQRLGAAEARNYGARHSSSDVLLFSDAHVTAPGVWARPLLTALARPGVGAVGPILTSMLHPQAKGYGLSFTDAGLNIKWLNLKGSQPYPVPLLGGFFLALRREAFEATGGFDSGMVVWGMEDLELCVHLWTLGHKCLLVPSVDVAHLDRERGAYPAYQCDWETGVHNVLRLAVIHFGARRIRRVVRHYAKDKVFPAALGRLIESDAWRRRQRIQAARRHDDNWYFRRFNMQL
jgi:GT2 family glycosyltransferase